jgi:hypothetical protein
MQEQEYHLELMFQLDFPLPRQQHQDIQAQRVGQELHLLLAQVPNSKAATVPPEKLITHLLVVKKIIMLITKFRVT